MNELLLLVKSFGPIAGLMLFMIWKQMQIGQTKPFMDSALAKIDLNATKVDSISSRLDLIATTLNALLLGITNAKQQSEPDDSCCDLPTEEAVRDGSSGPVQTRQRNRQSRHRR